MKVLALGFSFLACIQAGGALANDDVTALKTFETSFRHAQASDDIQQIERLVCWDRATQKAKQDMRDILRQGLGHQIDSIKIWPFSVEAKVNGPLPRPSLRPTHVFIVCYLWPREKLGLRLNCTHYAIGKKDGKFYFAVSTRWPLSYTHFEAR
jgi:hypothetical protein